jgi:Protein of unknown function (DUF3467)
MSSDSTKTSKGKENEGATGKPVVPIVNWDDSSMKTSYANVVNAATTREEVTLFFGTNLTWNPAEAKEFYVRLSDRIVLNPYAAKRLWILLGANLKEYETRFGALNLDVGAQDVTQRGRDLSPS